MAGRTKPSNRTGPPPPSVRRALVIALVAYFVIHAFVPFGPTILYPLTLLATWVHEMGHGVTALLLGGRFLTLDIFGDASGLAYSTNDAPWKDGLIAAGGLLAPPFVGALFLGFSRGPRRAQVVLVALAGAIVASLVLWVRGATGFVVLPILALVLVGFISPRIIGSPGTRMVIVQFLGVVLAIDTVSRIDYLFTPSATIGGVVRTSDIAAVARDFGGYYLIWGVLLAATSFAFLAAGLYAAWRR